MKMMESLGKWAGQMRQKIAGSAIGKGYGAVVDSQFFARGMSLGEALAQANQGGIEQAYSKHAIVYAAIQSCALNLSQVPFRFYKGTDLEHDAVETSPYDAVFARPNPYMSRFQLWEATMIYLKLRGEVMWVLDFAGGNKIGGIPVGIYALDPCMFEPVINAETRLIELWKMRTKDGKEEFFEHGVEVLHFKKFNPYNPMRGLAPLEAAARAVRMGYSIRQLNESIMDNGAEPGGVLTAEGMLTPDQMRALRTSFEQRHTGAGNARKVAILHSGLKYQQTTMTPNEMAYKDLDDLSCEDILAALKVPKTEIFKYDDVRKETAEVQDRALWTKNLLPEMRYIEDELYATFFSKRPNIKVWGLFDEKQIAALQESLANKVGTATSLFSMGWPLNEINRVLDMGFEPVPWGDVGYLPFSVVPADMLSDIRSAEKDAKEEKPKADVPKSLPVKLIHRGFPGRRWIEKVEAQPVVNASAALQVIHSGQPSVERSPLLLSVDTLTIGVDKAMSRARRQAFWQSFVQSLTPVEMRFQSKLRRFFFEMRQDVLDDLFKINRAALKPELDALMRDQKEKIARYAQAFYQQSAEVGVGRIAQFGLSFDLSSVQVQKLVAERTGRIVGIVDTVERALRHELNAGVQAGEGVTAIAARVRTVMGASASRALTIARTEVMGSSNQAGLIAMREAKVLKHSWVTAGDEHVRESHQLLDGETILIGQEFKNGLQYPGQQGVAAEEVINCRCTSVPVIE